MSVRRDFAVWLVYKSRLVGNLDSVNVLFSRVSDVLWTAPTDSVYIINIVTCPGFRVLDGWLDLLTPSLKSLLITINYNSSQSMTAQDSVSFLLDYECLLSSLCSTATDLVLIYESVTSSVSVVRWLTLHSWTLNPTQLLNFWTLSGRNHYWINYVSFLYNFGANRIEITISNSSCYCVLIRSCENVSSDPLPSNGSACTVDSVTWGTCLPNCCLAMIICVTIMNISYEKQTG
jgi:hypothetical protein